MRSERKIGLHEVHESRLAAVSGCGGFFAMLAELSAALLLTLHLQAETISTGRSTSQVPIRARSGFSKTCHLTRQSYVQTIKRVLEGNGDWVAIR